MFYCEQCRIERDWPESRGRCELCEKSADCHEVPSRYLPDPIPQFFQPDGSLMPGLYLGDPFRSQRGPHAETIGGRYFDEAGNPDPRLLAQAKAVLPTAKADSVAAQIYHAERFAACTNRAFSAMYYWRRG